MRERGPTTSDEQSRLHAFLLRMLTTIGSIRPDERRDVLGAFLTLLGFMAGHALLETARDALFLAELPVSLLPWVYLTIAAIALVVTRYQSRLARLFRNRHELSGWLILSGLITIWFWLAIPWVGDWIFYALYAWSGVLATLVVVRFWTVLSDRFTVTQAKRLFAIIGSGSVLGAIFGSGLARVLTEILPARHVVLTAGLVLLASSFGPVLFGAATPSAAQPQPPGGGPVDVGRVGRLVWGQPYLRQVAIAVLISTVTFTLIDFVFKSTVARVVPDAELGAFFSSVYFTLNIVSLFVQLFAVTWILRRVRVSLAVAIVPLLLLAGSVGFVLAAGLATALLLKGADGALRYSMYRTTTELRFVPMSTEIRGRVKAFIDVIGQRGGQALASLLVLALLTVTTNEIVFALAAAATAGAWLFMAVALKQHYLDVFRQTLTDDITATRIEFPTLDIASLETLLTTLNSPDDRRVIAALDILAAQGKLRIVPALILYHPSPAIVMHALELFARETRDDVLPIVDRLLGHADERIRMASLRVRTALLADESALRRGAADASPRVRVTAFVGLASGGWMRAEEAEAHVLETLRDSDPATMLAASRALRALPTLGFDGLLHTLVEAADVDVQIEAVRAMRALADPSFTPTLMNLLAQRALRAEVRETLVSFGPAALSRLAAGLRDFTLSHAVRRHLPRTIAAFATPQASTILLRHLLIEPDGMVRFKILRALGGMRSKNPRLPLDRQTLDATLDQNVAAAFRLMRWKRALEHGAHAHPARRTEMHAVILGLLADKQAHTVERLFRLLNLQANDEEYLHIYRGLLSSRREARASSRELIENLVPPAIRRSILELVDDLYEATDQPSAPTLEPQRYRVVLNELLHSGVESLSSLAAAHLAELELTDFSEAIVGVTELSPEHAEVLRDALVSLGAAPTRGAQ